jgi:TM2 domain-containing membrane protein YozV
MKNKTVAAMLAMFFGFFGVHRFYLGQRFLGVLYMVMAFFAVIITAEEAIPLVIVPGVLALIDTVLFFAMPKEEFDDKYNRNAYAQRSEGVLGVKGRRRSRRDQRRERRHMRRDAKYAVRPPDSFDTYKSRGIDNFRNYYFKEAAEDFERALEMRPNDISLHFNLACTYSIMEDAEPAFYHLEEAVSLGFNKFDKINQHDALAYIRSLPEYDVFVSNHYQRPKAQLPPVENTEELVLDSTPTSSARAKKQSILDQIIQLGELRDKGILTNEEFAEQKRRLLN